MKWQLTDVVTVFNSSNEPIVSIVNAEPPVLIAGPYNPGKLPAPPAFSDDYADVLIAKVIEER